MPTGPGPAIQRVPAVLRCAALAKPSLGGSVRLGPKDGGRARAVLATGASPPSAARGRLHALAASARGPSRQSDRCPKPVRQRLPRHRGMPSRCGPARSTATASTPGAGTRARTCSPPPGTPLVAVAERGGDRERQRRRPRQLHLDLRPRREAHLQLLPHARPGARRDAARECGRARSWASSAAPAPAGATTCTSRCAPAATPGARCSTRVPTCSLSMAGLRAG